MDCVERSCKISLQVQRLIRVQCLLCRGFEFSMTYVLINCNDPVVLLQEHNLQKIHPNFGGQIKTLGNSFKIGF